MERTGNGTAGFVGANRMELIRLDLSVRIGGIGYVGAARLELVRLVGLSLGRMVSNRPDMSFTPLSMGRAYKSVSSIVLMRVGSCTASDSAAEPTGGASFPLCGGLRAQEPRFFAPGRGIRSDSMALRSLPERWIRWRAKVPSEAFSLPAAPPAPHHTPP